MEKVLIRIPKGGTLEVDGDDPKKVYMWLMAALNTTVFKFREVKRGPKKRVVVADEGSEAVPAE